jgi:recombinational DNA repair ATPase RecF
MLDDIFSELDADTEEHVFKSLLQEMDCFAGWVRRFY